VVTLELAPGSSVTEGTLIDRVGLGRTPVREAIQRLAWEGLMEIQLAHRHTHRPAGSRRLAACA
jgi:DNA-binding GntR family transcriptional regulator